MARFSLLQLEHMGEQLCVRLSGPIGLPWKHHVGRKKEVSNPFDPPCNYVRISWPNVASILVASDGEVSVTRACLNSPSPLFSSFIITEKDRTLGAWMNQVRDTLGGD